MADMSDDETDDDLPAIPEVYVMRIQETRRSIDLRAKQSYLRQTQHDHRNLTWDGGPRDPGIGYMRERLEPYGFTVTNGAPYGNRRPSCPYPIGRQVIRAFTDMVFGSSEPDLSVPADQRTGRYLAAIMRESNAWDTLSESRDFSGACGETAILAEVIEGEPSTERLNTADLKVIEWEDRKGWVPAVVIEQRLVETTEEDEKTKKLETVKKWRTRYWDRTHTLAFEDVPEDYGKDEISKGEAPPPILPEGEPVEHHAGRCPVVWLQNTRSSKSPAGESDLDGVHETADQLDKLQSMTIRASNANADPTLVYKDERAERRRNPQLKKGYGARIDVGPNGDVKLLETTGSSIETAWIGIEKLRFEILQTTGAVIVTPESASNYKSGKAIQMLWRTMESRCSMRLRVPLETGIRQLCAIWIAVGTAIKVASVEDEDPKGVILPPRVIEPKAEDKTKAREAGKDVKPKLEPHQVGDGSYVEVRWSPYHEPTAEDLLAYASALANANGQKPLISKETATREFINVIGNVDPDEELDKIAEEHEEGMEEFGAAIGGAGGVPFGKPGEGAKDDDAKKKDGDKDDGAGDDKGEANDKDDGKAKADQE